MFVAVLHFILSIFQNSTALPLNYLLNARKKYGETIFLTIRLTERLTARYQKSKCDIEYLRLCLIYNLTPKFIRFKLWKNELKSEKQYQQFQRQCILTEYKNRNRDSIKIKNEIDSILSTLKKKLKLIDYQHLLQFLHERAKYVNKVTTETHKKKIKLINHGITGQDYESMKDKILHNMSSHKLTLSEERLLCRGMNFCIESKLNNYLEFQTDVELNMSKIENLCHPTAFRSLCHDIYGFSKQLMNTNKKKSMRNISDEEMNAIKTLKENKSIVICKADKGNAIVVLDKNEYIAKAKLLLENKQFKRTKNNLIEEKEKEMNKYLQSLLKSNTIDKQLFYQLRSTCSSPAVFYGQPKIHKINNPLRPIISTTATYNHHLSQHLTRILSKQREKPPSFVKDSFELMKKITNLKTNNNEILVSFDIESLYTNIPVSEAIETALDLLYKEGTKPDCPYDRTQFKKLLELSSLNVPFRFLEENYVQQDGVAMGSPIAPILADIFISKLEEKLNRFTTNKPKTWYRYVDDVFCIFNKKQNINDFLSRINKWHPNIRFTIEYENNECLPFLDLLIIRRNNKFDTTVYRKPTTTNLYLLYDSNQARKYKLGLIKSLYVRSLRLCSDETYLKIERDHLIKTLQQNGYPLHIIKRGIKEANAIYKRLNNLASQPQPQKNQRNLLRLLILR
jgi:hypothetical protein